LKDPFLLELYLDRHREAKGVLFIDDGETYNYKHKGEYNFIEFEFKDNKFSINPIHFGYHKLPTVIDIIQIRGYKIEEVPEVHMKVNNKWQNLPQNSIILEQEAVSLTLKNLKIVITEKTSGPVIEIKFGDSTSRQKPDL
jgi:hypothetical protein